MKKNPFLSVIIPAYNEEDRIRRTLNRIHQYLSQQDYSYEVLVVIDGATDNTFEAVKSLKKSFGNKLNIINNLQNYGKGYVVRQGMLAAKGEFRIFTDADNSTDISYLEPMLVKFKEGYEVVIASRDKKDAPGARQAIPQPWYKRQLGNLGNLFIQILVLPGIWDTQAGFKGFSAKAAQEIFSRSTINGFGFDIEVLAIARHLGYQIAIIPVVWRNDPKSHVKFKSYFQVLGETIKVRWYLWSRKYDKS